MDDDSRLNELLANPPGDGVEIEQVKKNVRITVGGRVAWSRKRRAWACGLVFLAMFVWPGLLLFGSIWLKTQIPHFVVTILLPIPIGLVFVAGMLLFFAVPQMKSLIEIGPEQITLTDSGKNPRMGWSEIREIRALDRKEQDWQLIPDLNWPLRKGHGAGVAFNTEAGDYRALTSWHHEVCHWLADVMQTAASMHGYQLVSDVMRDRGEKSDEMPGRFPAKVDGSWRISGVLTLVLGLAVLYITVTPMWEASKVDSWVETEAVITLSEPRDENHEIEYEYQVDGQQFTSDRYSFSRWYSEEATEIKRGFVVGHRVTIWYAPDRPDRAVIDRAFPRSDFGGVLFAAFVCLFGLGILIWSCLAKNKEAARRFDVQPEA